MSYDPANRDGGSDGPGLGTLMLVLLLIVAAGAIYFAFETRRQATLAAIRAEHEARYRAEQARAQLQSARARSAAIGDEPPDPAYLAEQLDRSQDERDRLESEVAALRETVADLQRRLDEATDPGSDRADPVP
jgi:hypothetical protein